MEFRLDLPHVAFNRRVGEFAAIHADTDGNLLSDAQWQAAKQAMLEGGAPEWLAEGQAEQFRFRWQGKQSRVTSTIADVAGKKPTSFEDFAREYASYFRGEANFALAPRMPSGAIS